MSDMTAVGKSFTRVDAQEKVTGTAVFGHDLKFPGMLCGKILGSKYAHARILNVDITRAKKLVGVRVVVTGKDIPLRFGNPHTGIIDQPFIAADKVRLFGEPVAAVAAIDEDIAEEALELIKVEYEELPGVFDPVQAMEPGASILHEDLTSYERGPIARPVEGTNICHHPKMRKGDVEQGFRESDFIFEDTYQTQMVNHSALEPHVAVATVDVNGMITVWTPFDAPHEAREQIALAFNLPLSKVRIIIPYQGGGFGGKGGLTTEPIAIALAMKTNGKPVKVAFSRAQIFTNTMVRHPSIIEIKTGVKKDGTLWARQVKVVFNSGAYAEKGAMITTLSTFGSSGPYRIPNIQLDGFCVYTNTPVAGAMRGFGCPQVTWAFESQMDIIAEKLKVDRLEIRLKNAFETGDASPSGVVLKAVGLKECLRKAADQIGWNKQGEDSNRGKGIACMHKWQTTYPANVVLKVNEDGTMDLLLGAVEIGQGCNTVFPQMVAEELDVSVENIKVAARDTEITPYYTATVGSGATFSVGNAVMQAARDVREQCLNLACHELNVNKEQLVLERGRVFVKDTPERGLTFGHLAHSALRSHEGQFVGKGTYSRAVKPFDKETGQGFDTVWQYAAQAAEVEVDQDTGTVRVLKLAAAHDVGKAINPKLCQGQIEGAVTMGIGAALSEQMQLEKGRVLNPNLTDYKLSTALDITDIQPILVEEAHDEGPYGAKGLGEPALAPTAAAIGNAVSDAVGVRIKELPLEPEKILKEMNEHGMK